MKALMFGWEFPPHILGGLGTASYGLTKGMWQNGDMDITFVIPKPWGDEPKDFARIIGANSTPVAWRDVNMEYVQSRIGDVMDPQMYFDLRNHIYGDFNYMSTNDLGCIEFSGRYPENLLDKMRARGVKADAVDTLELSRQAGNTKTANIVLMGRLSRYFDFSEEVWQEALAACIAPKFLEMNKKAFALGRNV